MRDWLRGGGKASRAELENNVGSKVRGNEKAVEVWKDPTVKL